MKKTPKVSPRVRKSTSSSSITAPPATGSWTFLTNHTHVLLCLYRQPDRRLRDVANEVGVTERLVQRIVAELFEEGYLHITKEGRCNRYTVNADLRLRHPLEMQHTIGELMELLRSEPDEV